MIKAIIFDMDGVISDTNFMHAKSEVKVLKKYGIIIKENDLIKKYSGTKKIHIFQALAKEQNKKINSEQLVEEAWREVIKDAKKNAKPLPRVIKLIDELCPAYPLAVASASTEEFVQTVLTKFNLTKKFRTIITGDDVINGKPDPEIFLLAAKKLKTLPKNCLVFEDAINGMKAAKAAKMRCVGIVKNRNDKEYKADILIEKFSEINLEKIRKL